MPTDRLGDYVGNHGGAYTDMDGMSRQFTVIDHDKKTKIAAKVITEEELDNIKKSLGEYRAELIRRIVGVPAGLCPFMFNDYTIRGEENKTIEWNTDMLLDAGVPINQLRDICLFAEKAANIQD